MAELDLQKLMTEAADERRNIAQALLAIQHSLNQITPAVLKMEPVLASLEPVVNDFSAWRPGVDTAVRQLRADLGDIRAQLEKIALGPAGMGKAADPSSSATADAPVLDSGLGGDGHGQIGHRGTQPTRAAVSEGPLLSTPFPASEDNGWQNSTLEQQKYEEENQASAELPKCFSKASETAFLEVATTFACSDVLEQQHHDDEKVIQRQTLDCNMSLTEQSREDWDPGKHINPSSILRNDFGSVLQTCLLRQETTTHLPECTSIQYLLQSAEIIYPRVLNCSMELSYCRGKTRLPHPETYCLWDPGILILMDPCPMPSLVQSSQFSIGNSRMIETSMSESALPYTSKKGLAKFCCKSSSIKSALATRTTSTLTKSVPTTTTTSPAPAPSNKPHVVPELAALVVCDAGDSVVAIDATSLAAPTPTMCSMECPSLDTHSLLLLLAPAALDIIDTEMTKQQDIYEDSGNSVQKVDLQPWPSWELSLMTVTLARVIPDTHHMLVQSPWDPGDSKIRLWNIMMISQCVTRYEFLALPWGQQANNGHKCRASIASAAVICPRYILDICLKQLPVQSAKPSWSTCYGSLQSEHLWEVLICTHSIDGTTFLHIQIPSEVTTRKMAKFPMQQLLLLHPIGMSLLTTTELPFHMPLLGKGLSVAHLFWPLMVHYRCATIITPLVTSTNGAPLVRH